MNDFAKWVAGYLINSAWQIPVLALCAAGLVKVTARSGARMHYQIWVGCLVLAIVLPAMPRVGRVPDFGWRRADAKRVEGKDAAAQAGAAESDQIAIYTEAIVSPAKTNGAGLWLLWGYGLSILVGVVRLGRKLWVTCSVVREARRISLGPVVECSLLRSAEVLGVGVVEVYCSAGLLCPATVSWPRAMLLVPENFSSLPEDEAAAAIGHELAHVRRHDFAVNLAIEAVSVVAFYHPVTHWVKRRIAASREVVCDEMAAEVTTGRTAYAKALLSLAEGVQSECVRANLVLGVLDGSSVEMRVMKLIEARLPMARGYRMVAAVGCWVVLAAMAFGVMALSVRPTAAQAATAPIKLPAFDVISVRPSQSTDTMMGLQSPPDGVRATNINVHALLLEAYQVDKNQVVGEPAWAKTASFDIDAKVAQADIAAVGKLSFVQRRAMLQQILVDRFGLAVHHESRELPVYALVIAKSGSKMKKAEPDPDRPSGAPDKVMVSRGKISAGTTTMPFLASLLSLQMGRTVVDRTGLTGAYGLTLTWAPDEAGGPPGGTSAPDESGPSIFTAVQDQLGLKLEWTKAMVDVIVVDHVERPSEN